MAAPLGYHPAMRNPHPFLWPRRLAPPLAALLALLPLLLAGPSAAAGRPAAGQGPRNVIFLIGDGMGPAAVTLLRECQEQPTHLDSLLVGVCRTYSSDSRVTDSAAAVTALACGIKTKNGMIGLDPLDQPAANLLEGARARGLATGLVATSRITHATPAGFAAHVPERAQEGEIAAQMLKHRVDVLLGGGRGFFLPADGGGKRADGRDLLREAGDAGYQVLGSRADFLKPLRTPLLGLFHPDHMTLEIDRDAAKEPSLAEMTSAALTLLKQDPDGFFVMIEGSRIDHAEHDNDAGATLREMRAFDDAVGEAVAFARRDRHTLVVVTADHETGGLAIGRQRDGQSIYAFHPEVLERVRVSGWKMTRLLRGGAPLDSVMKACAGLDSLGDVDRSLVTKALAEKGDGPLDHAVNEIVSRRALVGWTTYGHTGIDVGLYAFGPGAERFRGVREDTDVAWTIADLARFDLKGITKRLRAEAGEKH